MWIAQLTDIWRNCPGMQSTAAQELGKTLEIRAQLQEIFEKQGPRAPRSSDRYN